MIRPWFFLVLSLWANSVAAYGEGAFVGFGILPAVLLGILGGAATAVSDARAWKGFVITAFCVLSGIAAVVFTKFDLTSDALVVVTLAAIGAMVTLPIFFFSVCTAVKRLVSTR